MTQIPTAGPATAPAKSLPARFMGILFAPRATYADVAAHPRWLGIFLTVFLITAAAATRCCPPRSAATPCSTSRSRSRRPTAAR